MNQGEKIHILESKKIPKYHKVTYAQFCCNPLPQKEVPYRRQITVVCNIIDYPGEVITQTSDLTTPI